MNVAHDSNDLARGLIKLRPDALANRDLLTDGIFIGKELLCKCLIDDDHAGRAGSVFVGEVSAAQDGNFEDAVIAGGNVHPSCSGRSIFSERTACRW